MLPRGRPETRSGRIKNVMRSRSMKSVARVCVRTHIQAEYLMRDTKSQFEGIRKGVRNGHEMFTVMSEGSVGHRAERFTLYFHAHLSRSLLTGPDSHLLLQVVRVSCQPNHRFICSPCSRCLAEIGSSSSSFQPILPIRSSG